MVRDQQTGPGQIVLGARKGLLAALIRPAFRASSGEEARAGQCEAVAQLERPSPKVTAILAEADEDISRATCYPASVTDNLRVGRCRGCGQLSRTA
jgi:hypothetical protein